MLYFPIGFGEITIASIYGPNDNKINFQVRLFQSLLETVEGDILLLEDMISFKHRQIHFI